MFDYPATIFSGLNFCKPELSDKLLAAAYVLGVFCALLGRLIIDDLADLTFTPMLLRKVARRFIDRDGKWSRKEILKVYDDAQAKGTRTADEAVSTGVLRRREQARMVRSSFLPLAMVLSLWAKDTLPFPLWLAAIGASVLALLVILFLFGYCESIVFQECQRTT